MTTRIVCVTPNAAIDRTLVVPGYARGGIFRPMDAVIAPGGKGLNVARALTYLGDTPRCAGFLAGHTGRLVAEIAAREGFESRWTYLADGETRGCTIVVDPDTRQLTVINESGPVVTLDDWQRLDDDVFAFSQDADCVCWCGSLPPGSTIERYIDCLRRLVAAGKTVFVDATGDPLRAAVRVRGINVKVNEEEAASITGVPVYSRDDALNAARLMVESCGGHVVVTRGSQGAVMVTHDGQTASAVPPELDVISAVGSGDSFMAALVHALVKKESPANALRGAVATGAANALTIGGGSFDLAVVKDIYERVTFTG